MEKKKRRYFPDEFKRQAAERVETSGLSVIDVAAELGIHETQLRRWMRQLGKAGTGAARRPITQAQRPFPADQAAENARLKRELHKAQAERDILKTYGPPRLQADFFDAAVSVRANVSGIGALLPAQMELRASRSSQKSRRPGAIFKTRVPGRGSTVRPSRSPPADIAARAGAPGRSLRYAAAGVPRS